MMMTTYTTPAVGFIDVYYPDSLPIFCQWVEYEERMDYSTVSTLALKKIALTFPCCCADATRAVLQTVIVKIRSYKGKQNYR